MKETFGARFSRLRKEAGLTQEGVAEKLNISSQAVSKWENDNSCPDITALPEIAEMLCVTTDYLLGKDNEVVVSVNENKKDLGDMVLRILVDSEKDGKVKVNLPLSIVKVVLDSDLPLPQINGKDVLSAIDFNEIFRLIEHGVMGNLIEVEGKDGETVKIFVE